MTVPQRTFRKVAALFLSIVSVIPHGAGASFDKSAYQLPQLSGVNLAGIEFGIQTNGEYLPGSVPVYPPPTQIPHFIKQNVNLFRVPFAWELFQSEASGKLNTTNVQDYQTFVESITTQGAYVIIDLHAFARYKKQIVGQEVSADILVSLWTQLGEVFKNNSKVMFGIMNEPHDLDIKMWATTVQQVVTALRKASIMNIVLIPGTEYTSMASFASWYDVMKVVENPDKTHDGILIELHRYLDKDNAGKDTECVGNRVDEVTKVTQMLQADKRQVLLAEFGGGNTDSCAKYLPQLVQAVAEAFPTFVGWAMWSAGSFDEKYELVITIKSEQSSTGWQDQKNWLSIQKFLPTKPVKPSGSVSKKAHRSKCRP